MLVTDFILNENSLSIRLSTFRLDSIIEIKTKLFHNGKIVQ